MLIPAVGFTLMFYYLPMSMNVIAFMDYNLTKGWLGLGSTWVGFKQFQRFLVDPTFYEVALRTLYYAVANLVFSFPAPIILALLLNELRVEAYKRTVQTISYMPFFVSWVTVAGLIYIFLSTSSSGLINNVIQAFGGKRIIFMSKSQYFLPVLVFSTLWKGVGLGSIIYLATIASIEQQLYEAARIDGANRYRQMVSITLPSILPTIVTLLILAIGHLLSVGFEKVYLLYNPAIYEKADVIATYIYREGITNGSYSFATAVSLFSSVVGFVLLITANQISKKVNEVSLW